MHTINAVTLNNRTRRGTGKPHKTQQMRLSPLFKLSTNPF